MKIYYTIIIVLDYYGSCQCINERRCWCYACLDWMGQKEFVVPETLLLGYQVQC